MLYEVITLAYANQMYSGLITTAMRDQVSWGFYISNFTFMVGVAAAAVLLVIPAYVYQWKPIKEIRITSYNVCYTKLLRVFLLILNVFLLVVGSFMHIFSAIVVVVPIIAPLAAAFDVHPVHLGIIFLANLELGFLMPPAGMNLFLSAYRFDRPLAEVYRSVLPFLLILFLGVLVITYVPFLSTISYNFV